MKNQTQNHIPFSMLVGLTDAKLALILAVIDPRIGGVLISGPKGTGKSTLVRSLPGILPEISYVSDCLFKCNPFQVKDLCEDCKDKVLSHNKDLQVKTKPMEVITLPLGATEDRVIGSLDIEKIIGSGIEALSPGVLANANQEILYIDEINLLPDHLVDTILDCAASGWNIIERENISIQHPSRFILVGTMNPEEGDLRPQLLDRLSLFAQAENIQSVQDRIKIVELNLKEGNDDWRVITEPFRQKDKETRDKIIKARKSLNKIDIPFGMKKIIASLCMALRVDGFRSDIVLARASRAKAAFEDKKQVTPEDILECAPLTLLHRTREGGMKEPPSKLEINKIFAKILDKFEKK
ncbi:MAG: ATP-binding protein [Candidatus Hodarchaeales archaeon]